MYTALANFDWNHFLRTPMALGIIAMLIPVVAVVSVNWRRAAQSSATTRLIQQMVAKGYSADEIERVLRAGSVTLGDRGCSEKWQRFMPGMRPHRP